MLAAAWLAWQQRDKLRTIELRPAPVAGWIILLLSLLLMAVTRSQDIPMIEVATPNPGAFGMPAAYRRLAAGPHFRLSSCLSYLFCASAQLAA